MTTTAAGNKTAQQSQADNAQEQAEQEAKGRLSTLSARTKEIMDTDIVRPAQLQSYEPLIQGDLGKRLGEFEDKDLRGFAARSPVPSRELSNELREAMTKAKLPPSHVWVKGIIATYVVLQEEKARLEASAKKARK